MLPEEFNERKVDEKLNFKSFDWENFLLHFRYPILFLLLGALFVGAGIFFFKSGTSPSGKIEVLEEMTESDRGEIVLEVGGAVEKPGVYKLPDSSRVEDALIAAGGLSEDADRSWVEKSINRAAKIADGQKIFIPRIGESPLSGSKQSGVLSAKDSAGYQTVSMNFDGQGSGLININSANQKELESLNGIGLKYAQNIIEHRPYSTIEEVVSKGAIPKHVFEKIKNEITAF